MKIEFLMKQANIMIDDRKVAKRAVSLAEETKKPAVAIELADGRIVCGKKMCIRDRRQ